MTLKAIKTTTGYVVEGTDQAQKDVELFFDKAETHNFDRLVEIEDQFKKNQEFQARRAALPDPERDLYLSVFGSGDEPTDTVLHTTLSEVREAQDGIQLDWDGDAVTTALRLITQGEGNRLRLIAGRLVDMGPTASASTGSAGTAASGTGAAPDPWGDQ